MKSRLFTQQNISNLYLSPYVDYLPEGEQIVFRNDLFRQVVITPPLKTDAASFVDKLREGMSEEDLLNLFRESFQSGKPGELLAGFMQKGILE